MANPKRISVLDYEKYDISNYGDKIEVTNAIMSFKKWIKALRKAGKQYKVAFTEMIVVGEKLGGTIDCGIAGFDDSNKIILVDYKTSSGIYLTMFLQLAAYVMIYEELYGKDKIEGIMVIRLDKKHGDKAEARLIKRDRLDPFISAFKSMYYMASNIKLLENVHWSLTERIG